MRKIAITKEFSNLNPDPVTNIISNILKDMPEELRIAVSAGCQLETFIDPIKNTIMIRTRYPVSILRSPEGAVIDVYEKKK